MKEIKAIIEAYQQAITTKKKAALATVVRVEGSSYRRTGARMLVMEDGTWIGGISGGCLEGDALKRARLAIAKSEPSLITYDTTEDDQYQIGVGLGCNGIIDVLFTPLIATNLQNPVEILKNCMAAPRQTHVLLTITNLDHLDKNPNRLERGMMIRYDGAASLTIFQDQQLEKELMQTIEVYQQQGRSRPKVFELSNKQKIEIFIEIVPPEIHLILMGHQYDVLPLARLVKEIGWRVTVIANPQKVMRALFMVADAIVAIEDFPQLIIDEHTAIILMSHDYKTDKYNLPKVLKTASPYIGILGPRVRSERIFNELAQEKQEISLQDMSRIYGPVGLDIGAISPEEIALSIAAEIRATLSGRNGTPLRQRKEPIHTR